ncbi:Lactonase, 7-bladed beta-propeller [Terriglobus roseus]|uniref:Lactonase, 7-bladed beta-propeller n=2 Tax=Terriglobus roseus TaxID=392734 RepID=A0A1H4PGI3_9BACT|nr:Lactonase, 7-bladed beta-propeller [Terriglobus roseus]
MLGMRPQRVLTAALFSASFASPLALAQQPQTVLNLPTSKQLLLPVPGAPQRLNSLPMAMATSPDGRYVAVVNGGYGTAESDYQQSIAIINAATDAVQDFPERRTSRNMPQTLYTGLVFSADGTHLYASLDSLTDPEGKGKEATGNAIAVYSFHDGSITPERLLKVPLQTLAPGRKQNELNKDTPAGKAIPVPTGLALVPGRSGAADQLLIADVYSDDVLLMDTATGATLKRFDLASSPVVPSTYPISLAVSRDGRRAFVGLWNGSAVAELDLVSGRTVQTLPLMPPTRPIDPSSHPAAMRLSADESRLYIALANRDAVAAVGLNGARMKLMGTWDTRLPGQTLFGAIPSALAFSDDGKDLFVANSGSNAIAVLHTGDKLSLKTPATAAGFIPTEWFPTAVTVHAGHLLVATGKGKSTGPNAAPAVAPRDPAAAKLFKPRAHAYIATLLYGSVASIDLTKAMPDLAKLSAAVMTSNRMNAAQEHLRFAGGTNPIKHVIYVIKENRTYDQILGDLGVGDGDPSLAMYGKSITPNEHKLALQYGVLDNFYDSGEVSGNGHVWSTAGITSDYTERIWQQSYRGDERMYDFEGVVEQGYPLAEGISDVNEPASGYIWTNLARHGKSLMHFGEFINTDFCTDKPKAQDRSPLLGTPEGQATGCPRTAIRPGEPIPTNYGGGTSPYPWPIPLIAKNTATKPELQNHYDPLYPDFELSFPEQLRFEEFRTHLAKWQTDMAAGHDTMPNFIMMRMGNDHTAGTKAGSPTPRASVADNDLAVGRLVDAVSHSNLWDSTAVFFLEDDAQDGADHVDAHRSIALIASKYAPHGTTATVDHNFYTTVSVLRTMEDLLGLPPMNNNDALAPLIQIFSGDGSVAPYAADYSNRDNKLIYTANTPQAIGAKTSAKMDFTHEDRADPRKLNVILWQDAMGNSAAVPQMILHPKDAHKDDDDD